MSNAVKFADIKDNVADVDLEHITGGAGTYNNTQTNFKNALNDASHSNIVGLQEVDNNVNGHVVSSSYYAEIQNGHVTHSESISANEYGSLLHTATSANDIAPPAPVAPSHGPAGISGFHEPPGGGTGAHTGASSSTYNQTFEHAANADGLTDVYELTTVTNYDASGHETSATHTAIGFKEENGYQVEVDTNVSAQTADDLIAAGNSPAAPAAPDHHVDVSVGFKGEVEVAGVIANSVYKDTDTTTGQTNYYVLAQGPGVNNWTPDQVDANTYNQIVAEQTAAGNVSGTSESSY